MTVIRRSRTKSAMATPASTAANFVTYQANRSQRRSPVTKDVTIEAPIVRSTRKPMIRRTITLETSSRRGG